MVAFLTCSLKLIRIQLFFSISIACYVEHVSKKEHAAENMRLGEINKSCFRFHKKLAYIL